MNSTITAARGSWAVDDRDGQPARGSRPSAIPHPTSFEAVNVMTEWAGAIAKRHK
ncbi:MAG: hypothetical protein O3C67_09455 [Cyanobacteria bacterium]|nr:hypothetical protein [Cyanobacteriota bacterium]